MALEVVFFPISMLTLGVAVIYYIRGKHLERMEMIKRGEYTGDVTGAEERMYSALSKGILLLSLAIGLVIAYLITRNMPDSAAIIIFIISVFGSVGLGLLGYYLMLKKRVK